MPDPTMTPEEIAAKLTKAQRAWVLAGGYCDDKWLKGAERKCLERLNDQGLFMQTHISAKLDFVLSELGMQVRRILEGQGE